MDLQPSTLVNQLQIPIYFTNNIIIILKNIY